MRWHRAEPAPVPTAFSLIPSICWSISILDSTVDETWQLDESKVQLCSMRVSEGVDCMRWAISFVNHPTESLVYNFGFAIIVLLDAGRSMLAITNYECTHRGSLCWWTTVDHIAFDAYFERVMHLNAICHFSCPKYAIKLGKAYVHRTGVGRALYDHPRMAVRSAISQIFTSSLPRISMSAQWRSFVSIKLSGRRRSRTQSNFSRCMKEKRQRRIIFRRSKHHRTNIHTHTHTPLTTDGCEWYGYYYCVKLWLN